MFKDPSPDDLDAYLDLKREEIARLVLCLLIEEALKGRLSVFRQVSEQGDQ